MTITEQIGFKKDIVQEKGKGLVWYSHVMRMVEKRLLEAVWRWFPPH